MFQGEFKGPVIKLIEPIIDFGLVKVNSKNKFRVILENTSPIPTEVLIRNVRNTSITFNSLSSIALRKQSIATETLEGNILNLLGNDTPVVKLPANSQADILLQLESHKVESLVEYFEVLVKGSPETRLYFQALAEIQKPMVTLSRWDINLGTIYAGVPVLINRGELSIKNYGNLPAQFHWEERIEQDRTVVRFEPSRGVIPPKSETKV